jgi:putative addiction module component (TIGR02574 family)
VDTSVIFDAFRELPQDGRLEGLCQLWDQMLDEGWVPAIDDERKAELDRRWEQFRANPASGRTWDQVRDGHRDPLTWRYR